MKNRVIIDFESRSHIDLRKSNPWVYAEHPSTEIMCCAFKFENEETQLVKTIDFRELNKDPSYLSHELAKLYHLARAKKLNITFEAHNAFFERCLWHHIMVKKYGFPEIELERWYCSAAKAAYQSLPRALDKVCKVLKLKNQKDDAGHKLMLKMCKPRKPTKNNPAIWHETLEQIAGQEKYCVKDVDAEHELSKVLPELPPIERKIWLLDQEINDRGLYCDVDNVDKLIVLLDRTKDKYKKEIHELTHGYVSTPNQVAAIKEYLRDYCDYDLPDLSKQTVSDALEQKSLDEDVKRILSIRQAASKSSVKKLHKIKSMRSEDGRCRDLFMYHGARTGRWTGRGVQVQNLPRKTFSNEALEMAIDTINEPIDWIECLYSDINDFSSKLIRPMFTSSPGKVLIAADLASIEARVLVWLAEDEKGLELYNTGKDPYVYMASDIFNMPVKKIIAKGSDCFERFIGKQSVLGLGYGMGALKFKDRCDAYGVEIPFSLADRAKNIYRKKRKSVVDYWYAIERAQKKAIITKKPVKFKNLVMRKEKGNLYIDLPSGRSLCYQSIGIDDNDNICYMGVVSGKWLKIRTWGGKITENVDQAISRDALALAMLRLKKKGYDTVLHVHDEPVAEVHPSKANLDDYIKILCEKPSWLKGCPIKAEGWIGKRYRKG